MKKITLIQFFTAIVFMFSSANVFSQQQICEGDVEQYDVANTTGSNYDWEVLENSFAGTITGDGTNAIDIDWGTTPPGTYTLKVTEEGAGGCLGDPVSITVTINEVPNAPVVSITQPGCGDTFGSFNVTSPTGSGLEYSIDGGATYQSATLFDNLAPGAYQVMARNAAGCESDPANVTIDPLVDALSAPTVATTQPDCGDLGGTIDITAPTGSGLEYSIDGGQTYTSTATFTDLPAGNYDVMVKNADGCESSVVSVTIDPVPSGPNTPTLAEYHPDCSETNGTLEVTAPLGANYEYSIDNGATYQSSPVFSNLAPGTYDIQVKDTSGGCVSSSASGTINSAPAAPQTSPINFN